MRSFIRISFWLLSVAGLYVSFVLLEVYWNLFSWQPRFDLASLGILLWMLMMLVALWHLCRSKADRITEGVAVVLCTALVALAIYVVTPEPLKPGLLGRERVSPLWYRAGRLFIMLLPVAFWVLRKLRRTPQRA